MTDLIRQTLRSLRAHALRFTLTALVLVWFVKPPWRLMGQLFVIALISAAVQYSWPMSRPAGPAHGPECTIDPCSGKGGSALSAARPVQIPLGQDMLQRRLAPASVPTGD